MSDIVERAEKALALRWETPGPDYPGPVPTGVVWLGDWASEELRELVAELKAARAEAERLRLAASSLTFRDQVDRSAPQFPGTGLGPQG